MKCIKCNQETGAAWKTLCYSCYKNRSTEEIREARQKKLDKKVQRLKSKAERLQREADSKLSVFDPYKGDTAFFTQPATPNSRFGRQRTRMSNRYEKGLELSSEANKKKEKEDL